jgi:hypothetical protein
MQARPPKRVKLNDAGIAIVKRVRDAIRLAAQGEGLVAACMPIIEEAAAVEDMQAMV